MERSRETKHSFYTQVLENSKKHGASKAEASKIAFLESLSFDTTLSDSEKKQLKELKEKLNIDW